MTCDELEPEYGAYAMGTAEEPECSEIAAHLTRRCPVCTPGVRSAMGIVSVMSGAVKPADPPRRLRARIVAMVSPTERRSWGMLVPWGVAGVLAIVLMSVVLPGRFGQTVSKEKLDEVFSILNDPTVKDVAFGDPAARGRVFVSPRRGVVLMASHLPAIAADRTFELWVIPSQGNPIPAGTFRSNDDSTAVYLHEGAVDNAAAVAVTVEPKGGSQLPTTKPFIVTKL